MPNFSTLALLAWLPLSVAFFAFLPPRPAILVIVIGGSLLLPVITLTVPGPLPTLNKLTVSVAGVLLGILLFDRSAFWRVRPAWFDVPMLAWVVSPFLSSLMNGLGIYDGLSAVVENLLTWGVSYWLGRAYFFEMQGLRELALGIFVGGLVYVPLCWLEIINGPYLHLSLYGTYPSIVAEALRFGGWRPVVLMKHGLMVALWMTVASVSGIVLLLSGELRQWGRWLGAVSVLILVATTIALKSVNAWGLLTFAVTLLIVSVWIHRPWFLWCAVASILAYLGARTVLGWNAREIAELTGMVFPGKRSSVLFRLVNEAEIIQRVWLQPLWGWGRWGRAFTKSEGGLAVLTPDSLWIVALGQQGFVGLLAMLGSLFLPPVLFALRAPPAEWLSSKFAPLTACAFAVLIFALDSLFNAMMLPIYLVAAGGVTGWVLASKVESSEPQKRVSVVESAA